MSKMSSHINNLLPGCSQHDIDVAAGDGRDEFVECICRGVFSAKHGCSACENTYCAECIVICGKCHRKHCVGCVDDNDGKCPICGEKLLASGPDDTKYRLVAGTDNRIGS